MNYWLMKSEPDVYGIDDLLSLGEDYWDGIRNYQARNFIRDEMRIGDQAFFYHSNCKEIGIVGRMEIISAAYPDDTAFDPESDYFDPKSNPENPRWLRVDVRFKEKFNRLISLQELKAEPMLEGMLVLRKGNRLSITPVEAGHWNHIIALANPLIRP